MTCMDESGFSIQTPHFSGPLELLLNLVEARKLYINDVSLAQVTDDYLSYVSRLDTFPAAETAQFILIASTLLLIKSRSLLPDFMVTEEEEQEIADLEKRLNLYKAVRDGSRVIKRLWGASSMWDPQRTVELPPVFAPGEMSVELIHAAAKNLINGLPASVFRPETRVAKKVTLEEVMDTVLQRIQHRISRFSEFVKKGAEKETVILHFLAILELARRHVVTLEQGRHFDDIIISHEAVSDTPKFL